VHRPDGPCQVGIEHVLQLLVRPVHDAAVHALPGIGDNGIDTAERLEGALYQPTAVFWLLDLRSDGKGSVRAQLDDSLSKPILPARCQDNSCPRSTGSRAVALSMPALAPVMITTLSYTS